MPRRRANVLLPLEEQILVLGLEQARRGEPEVHGFALAVALSGGDRSLTAHGTLYKVLERLEERGLLASRWESDEEYDGGRPRRRLYRVTAEAARALALSQELTARPVTLRPGVTPT